ncbi:MAG: TRAP transporter large permease subunit [Synergistaceae bacterium]|jgi:tripartite ATP-independent transporter DctM subunit|nr:TRAP transporter large permease subunit [Synergistaceae bacterium]
MTLMVSVFLILLFLGMPVAFAIGLSGFIFIVASPDIPVSITVQRIVSQTQNFTLLAIPLFIFAGNLMNSSGITERLVNLSRVLVGHLPGSLAQVSVIMSTLMGGVSGSANADAVMESRILGPEMIKQGYSRGYGAAVNGLTALITCTIPPSMGFVIYGSVGEVSIGRLFVGGVLPGLLMMVFFMVTVHITSKRRGYMPITDRAPTANEVGRALVQNVWALIFPFILIAGIRFGVFTPSESGAFAAAYAVFVGSVIYKEMTLKAFWDTAKQTLVDVGVLMLILGLSGTFGYAIVFDRMPQTIAEMLLGITSNQHILLILIIFLLILAGMFIETGVIALLLTPVFIPVITRLGIDPVHFGVVMMTTVTAGIMTPPVGVALYSTSEIMGCSPQETAKEAIPFYIMLFILVMVLIFFPQVVLFLPNLVFG